MQPVFKSIAVSIIAIVLLSEINACKKENANNPLPHACDSCYCRALKDTLQLNASETDSAVVISKLKGFWNLRCVVFTSKYGNSTFTRRDSLNDLLSVHFTDSTYTYFMDDSLLFTFNYFVSSEGFLRSDGNSFYFGNLGASAAVFKNDMMGINTTYPYTGGYYLSFQRIQ